MLWAAYSALAEVEESRENCKRAIDACQAAIRIYERISPAEHADALKNLGYSFITLAEMEDKAKNCRKAIDAYESALQYYTLETAPLEHAEILRDLAFAHVTLSAVEDKEECCKKALKAYKKAFKIYQARSEELEREGDPGAHEMRSQAEKCHRSMQSCKAIFKAGRKAGAAATIAGEVGSMTDLTEEQKAEYFRRSYTAVDGLWFMKVEERLGFDEACSWTRPSGRFCPRFRPAPSRA